MKPTRPKRLRRHKDAPANWQWRDGRPRWIASPGLRKGGWRGHDLKDAAGLFLGDGASRDRARDINAAVAAWKRGETIPEAFAVFAPPGAWWGEGAEEAPLPVADRLDIGPLIEAYLDSREVRGTTAKGAVPASALAESGARRPGRKARGLAPKTQATNRQGLKRMVDVLAGYAALPDKDDADAMRAYTRAVAVVKASPASILAPTETSAGMIRMLYDVYWKLFENAGPHQAHRVMASVSGWLKWCQQNESSTIRQAWAADVDRETPPGRIRPWTLQEFLTMVETADRMGHLSIGDSFVLGLDLSWSQVDRLALPWNRLRDFRAFTGLGGRAKTGRVGGTPLTSLGRNRVTQIIARQAKMPAKPTHVIWCETTNKPWHPKSYQERVAEIRAEAAKTCPSLLIGPPDNPAKGVGDSDLRDTAFTWMKNAGLDNDAIASRTIQSRKNIDQLGDNHYGEIGPDIADPAGRKWDAYLIRIGASS